MYLMLNKGVMSSCVMQTHDGMQKSETEEVIWGLGLKCVLEVELTSKIETDNQ